MLCRTMGARASAWVKGCGHEFESAHEARERLNSLARLEQALTKERDPLQRELLREDLAFLR
jgi:hypothetical protein